MELAAELCLEPVADDPVEVTVAVCETLDVLLEPEPYPEVEMLVTFSIGGRLDCVGIATVVSRGFDVVVRIVASGPIVMGTPKIAQSSATTEKVSVFGEYGVALINARLVLWASVPTLLVRIVTRSVGAIVHPLNIHIVRAETGPFT